MERKNNFNKAFKRKCVKLVLEKNFTNTEVSRKYGVSVSYLKKWVELYRKLGEESFHRKLDSSYSLNFKLKVINDINVNCLTLLEACVKYKIGSESTIFVWQQKFSKFGMEGLQKYKQKREPIIMAEIKRKKRKSTTPLTREEELLQENEKLRAENDLLKKLHAFAQAAEKQKQKP
jgi:transposase